jgi:hypothetical protein
MEKSLSKLEKIDLRDIWPHEALDFTKWLAEEENLDLLSNEIGISLKLIGIEVPIGNFNLDILAEEENTGHKIIIENQLEPTNHDHLGKIITYAAGKDAKVILWIVRDAREEHRQAIEWLNNRTDNEIGFFLIKIEAYKIDNSPPAPKFELICKPNEWAKITKTNLSNSHVSRTKLQQLEFWESFKDYVRTKDSAINLQTPSPKHWYDVSIGTSLAHIGLTVNTKNNQIACEFYINKDKDFYKYLQKRIKEIESDLNEIPNLVDAKVASSIKIQKKTDGIFATEELKNNFKWLYDKTILFKKVFPKYINEFKALHSK